MKVRHFFFDPLVLEKFFDGKLRFDEDFQTVEVEVKKNSQKFLGPFSPVKLAHWEKSCETWQRDVWTFSLDVMRGPNSWYMVVSPFRPKSSQYTFGCLSPSDWEKGKNWKRLPFSGVWQKTTFSPALSALKNRFLKWGFQYQTLSILSPSDRCALGVWTPKYFEAVSFDRGLFTHYVWWKLSIDEN